jgi:hypothetical protein
VPCFLYRAKKNREGGGRDDERRVEKSASFDVFIFSLLSEFSREEPSSPFCTMPQ